MGLSGYNRLINEDQFKLSSLDISKSTDLLRSGGYANGLYLNDMPSLYEICVWIMPFPPVDAPGIVDTEGSPNVFFTTDCE